MSDQKQPTKKLHHFVPQAYLRGFATADKERITAVRLPGEHSFTALVKNVAAQTHFHRVEGIEQPDSFEDVLADLEGEAQKIIAKLAGSHNCRLTEAERMILAFFIALQSVRGPDTRRTSEAMSASIIRMEVGAGGRAGVAGWARARLGIDPDEETQEYIWQQATQPGGPALKFSNLSHIGYMTDTAAQLSTYVFSRPWVFITFERRALITSDSPIGLVADRDAEEWEGVGFANAAQITFPLTRRLGMLMLDPMKMLEREGMGPEFFGEVADRTRKGEGDFWQPGSTRMARFFNRVTVDNASEYIYHHPEDITAVPADLPEPRLVNMEMIGDLHEHEWDGSPLFKGSTKAADD